MKEVKIRRLIWDIETSPDIAFTWRVGFKINLSHDNILKERAIICVCYKWEGDDKVYSLEWDNGDDYELCKQFLEVAKSADELVAHNGDNFDIKWLNTRCLKHNLDPSPIWTTVDTLQIAKKRFYFNSNKLDYLGSFLCGERKIHTEFNLWKDICLDNCPKAMQLMVDYCKQDVLLLEKVWKKLSIYHRPKTHVGVHNDRARWTCPWTGSTNVCLDKRYSTAAGIERFSMMSNDTRQRYTIPKNVYQEYLEWKHKD